MPNVLFTVYVLILGFFAFMGIRISVAVNLSLAALSAVHHYNLSALDCVDFSRDDVDEQCRTVLIDYDTAIRSFDAIMWDFTAWSTHKAFVTLEDFGKCARMEESA